MISRNENAHDDARWLHRLQRLDSCAISDALDRLALTGAVSGLNSLTATKRIGGRVITVKLVAGKSLPDAPPRHLGTYAIEKAEPGDIVVIEQRSGVDAAGWGGILSTAAFARKLGGVIVEGPARDIDEAREIGFPVFARGATTRTARGRLHEASTGAEILVGDTKVHTGDYVVADGSGVAFIPQFEIGRVVEAAEKIAARELGMLKDVLSGIDVGAVMGKQYETLLHDGK